MEKRQLNCGELIKLIDDKMKKDMNFNLQSNGLTASQMKLLIILSEREGFSSSLKEIERYFKLSQATVAGIVKRLEKKELVEAFPDKSDKRIKHIRLTSDGLALCRRSRSIMDGCEKRLMSVFSDDEREQLRHMLQRLLDSIEKQTRKE